jgi:hypothetical protein
MGRGDDEGEGGGGERESARYAIIQSWTSKRKGLDRMRWGRAHDLTRQCGGMCKKVDMVVWWS